jgi:polysaccharide biosynthesis transport protein
MLHTTIHPADRRQRSYAQSPNEDGTGAMSGVAKSLLRRRYVLVFATAALSLALSVFYLRITPPTYTAAVLVLLDDPKGTYVKEDSPLAEQVLDAAQIETQMQIIRSPAIAVDVIKKLNLAEDPDFIGRSFSLGSVWRKIRDRIAPGMAQPEDVTPEAAQQALIGRFLDRVEVRRAGYGKIMEISASSRGAARAASIANAVADAYISDQLNSKFEAGRRATSWLQDRLQDLREQAQTAERAVDAYRAQHNIVSSGGKPIDEQQVTDLNSRLVAARAQASDAQARLNRFQTILSADWTNDPTVETMGAAMSDALNSSIINSLRTQYLDQQRREKELSAQFGKDHRVVVEMRSRIREIRNSIRDEVVRLAETTKNDYEVAQRQQQAIQVQLDAAVSQSRGTTSAEVALRELEARAKSYQTQYETFQQRYIGAVQLESFPISEARVISPALPPGSKSKPKTNLVLMMGALGGVALGVGLAFLRDLTDGVFRTPTQVETELQLPCLSVVPLTRVPKQRSAARGKGPMPDPQPRVTPNRNAVDSVLISAPVSRFAEAIRSLKVGIDLSPTKGASKVVGITSALPNEGKTTIAISLARLIAHSGKRVIIVDCDLRNPSLSTDFAPNAVVGLLEVVAGSTPLEEAVWLDSPTDLVILPTVRHGPLYHTSEILSSGATHALFERLRSVYDYVIVDLPPLSPVVDVRMTGTLVDFFVFVTAWGSTKIQVVKQALHSAPSVSENIVGVVLNKTDMKVLGHYESHSRELYSEKHYERYSDRDRA